MFKIDKNYKELLQFSSKEKVVDSLKLQEKLTKLITKKYTLPGTQNQPNKLVGKEIVLTWTVECRENRDWEGEIRSFENGVLKLIEYQIRQVFHPINEEFTLFQRINALTMQGT